MDAELIEKIKTKYVTTNLSVAALADEFGVRRTVLAKLCTKEKWIEQREKIREKSEKKIAEKAANNAAKRIENFYTALDLAAAKIIEAISVVEPTNTQGVRQLTSSLQDIQEMLHIKSDNDVREQNARIAGLEAANKDKEASKDVKIEVVFPETDESEALNV